MPSSPLSSRRFRSAAAACVGVVVISGFAVSSHADDSVINLVPPTTTTTTEVTTTTVTTTTVAPTTTAPAPTTAAPITTEAPTTVAPITTLPATVPVTEATVPATTKKPKPPTTTKPKANPNATGAASIEVDISRQTLYFRKGGTLVRTLHVSTGSGKRFCSGGKCQTAHTPRGRFRIQRRISGWRTSHLGRLYQPLYFTGGYAIHGAGSVPYYPASHGCVRITISSSNWLVRAAPNGTPVWIHE